MPIRNVPASSLKYYLLAFDEKCDERIDDIHGKLSDQVLSQCKVEQPSDIFIISHGWMGDVPAAISQYDKWISTMCSQATDIDRIKGKRENFKPLLIGLHWPSKPWGDENLNQPLSALGKVKSEPKSEVETYANLLGNTDETRNALYTILTADENKSGLTPTLQSAYDVVERTSGLSGLGTPTAAPGIDMPSFDAESIALSESMKNPLSIEGPKLDVRDPLRVLSFWKMKERARTFGLKRVHDLITQLQQCAPSAKIHLIGHSFGCVVVSSAVLGENRSNLVKPVDSLCLLQGAMSHWSLCPKIPFDDERPGFFSRLLVDRLVSGPIITTTSKFDYAVGRMYPIASRIGGAVDFPLGKPPKFGGLGTFGACGDNSFKVSNIEMKDSKDTYTFTDSRIYNLSADQFICDGSSPTSGAHCDIAKPQVAHLIWEAALNA